MITGAELNSLMGKTVKNTDGDKIGKISDVYESNEVDGQGTFVTVHTGMFGGAGSFVPLEQATVQGDDLVVPYTKDKVKDAPRVEADGSLSAQEEEALYRYYGLSGYASTPTTTGTTDAVAAPAGHDASGPDTDNAMTRSEERLQVGTATVEAGKARLRKRIVTENVSTTVPVSHEELVVSREPITEANAGAALSGADLTEEEHEVTLHAEKAVVGKETVPVERVQVGTQTVTEQQNIDETVRHEEIELDKGTEVGTTTNR